MYTIANSCYSSYSIAVQVAHIGMVLHSTAVLASLQIWTALHIHKTDPILYVIFCTLLFRTLHEAQAAEVMPMTAAARKGSRKRHSDSSSSSSGSESDGSKNHRSSNEQNDDSTAQLPSADIRK